MGQSVVARRPRSKPLTAVNSVEFALFPTACGWMGLAGQNGTVHHLRLGYSDAAELREELQELCPDAVEADWFPELRQKLQAYASGERVSFARVRCNLPSLTDFQKAVLQFVQRIPYGQVLSYGDVAKEVGFPRAARAVGTVMANNRLPLIIPCHRVIASGGKLGGYSTRRGTSLKQWLLDLEQAGVSK